MPFVSERRRRRRAPKRDPRGANEVSGSNQHCRGMAHAFVRKVKGRRGPPIGR